jgi:hypothetical protein
MGLRGPSPTPNALKVLAEWTNRGYDRDGENPWAWREFEVQQ